MRGVRGDMRSVLTHARHAVVLDFAGFLLALFFLGSGCALPEASLMALVGPVACAFESEALLLMA